MQTERPKAVTIIGWVWLILAGVSFLRCLIGLVLWMMLHPAAPTLLRALEEQSPGSEFLRPVLRHLEVVLTAQAVVSLAVCLFAVELLRLRPWARIAVQAACWLALTYVVCFMVLWVGIWTRVSARLAADASLPANSHGAIGLVVGLVLCLAVAGGLAAMIARLRSSPVRAAFGPSPVSSAS